MRSGYIRLSGVSNNDTFRAGGLYGDYWTSWIDGTSGAYYLHLRDTYMVSAYGPDNRWYGYPLRCLSTVLDI